MCEIMWDRGACRVSMSRHDGQEDIQRLWRESSHCTHSTTGILPLHHVGARNALCRVKLRRFLILPSDRLYRAWDTFLVLLVVYTAWVSPFEFAFLKEPDGLLSITNNVVNGFFAVDILLTFFVAYLDNATYVLIDNPKQIAWNYTISWLAFDVISIIPSELAQKIFPSSFHSYGLLTMVRLWRLRRVGAFFSRMEKDSNLNYFWVRLTKLICVTLFVVHFSGCFYYFLAVCYHDPRRTWIGASMEDFLEQSLWIQYVTSMYWSISYLTSLGAGNLHAQNTNEMIFEIFYMVFNFGLAAYLMGNITNLAVHWTSRTRKFRDTIQAASSFAQRNLLPSRLKDQMLAHLSLKFRTDSEGLQRQEALDFLPKTIQSSISHFLFYSLVDKGYLFRGVSHALLFQLVSEMKLEYFPPQQDVILQNEAPTDFYILVKGAVDLLVLNNGVEQVVGGAETGDLCGEIGVLCYMPQPFTVRTKQLSQLLRMNRAAFVNIVQATGGDGTVIMNNLLQHLKELKDPILVETENMLADSRMDLPLSLCFAILRGYDLLVHQLLKWGLDPNESDKNGRTALHIAASKGSENCALLLLHYGAEPNSRDLDGNVPLWEAISGGHKPVINLLIHNGAKIYSGDVGRFACTAAEQKNLNLLKEIFLYGGDITCPNSKGSTALLVAVREGYTEMVKFLLDQGAAIDRPDMHGCTPRDLADQLGHEDIKILFHSKKGTKSQSIITIPEQNGHRILARFKCEPSFLPLSHDGPSPVAEGSCSQSHPRRRKKDFHNSIFGIMSGAPTGEEDLFFSHSDSMC